MTRIRISTLMLLVVASLAASGVRALGLNNESLDQLTARAEAARPEDRPALYIEIAHRQEEAAAKLYDAGNVEAGNAALQQVTANSQKATDAAITTGKKLKNTEIALRKMAERFRDVKRNAAFEDQAPIQQTVDDLEKMRTDLLSAMFGKKKTK